jgi:hypothetical protein
MLYASVAIIFMMEMKGFSVGHLRDMHYSLQRHSTKNSKQIFPEKERYGLSPSSYIHVSVSYLNCTFP